MKDFNRRRFLQLTGIASIPAVMPQKSDAGYASIPEQHFTDPEIVSFIFEGPFYRPKDYVAKLQEILSKQEVSRDNYGQGGVIDELCKKMAEVTGKEAAVYIPTGTLANQLAISVLSGENSKVFVQETSHVYRDEADAAQTLFNKRLIPLAKGKGFFTADELIASIEYHKQEEVFKTGIGAVSIETPNRRLDNQNFPIAEIRKIADYCKQYKYKLHLDGARLHLDAAFTGVSVAEYSKYFDSVYMCLYKYLGANGGAVLCADKETISKMDHLIKIHGGSVFTNWPNAAIALYNLDGLELRLATMAARAKEFVNSMKQVPELKITALEGGTNVYHLSASEKIDLQKMKDVLRNKFFMYTGAVDNTGIMRLRFNETILNRSNTDLLNAFKDSVAAAKK